MVHGTDSAIGKGRSIEAGRSLGVLVVPQTNCAFLDIAWPFALENIHVPFTNEILSHDDGRR